MEVQDTVTDMVEENLAAEGSEVVEEAQEVEESIEQAEGIAMSDEDVKKMTDLIVQEMAGASVDGISQVVSTETTVISDSDSLLWTE